MDVLPGVAAFVGGLLLATTANRAVGIFAGWLASLAGAWFIVGPVLARLWNGPEGSVGSPVGGTARRVGAGARLLHRAGHGDPLPGRAGSRQVHGALRARRPPRRGAHLHCPARGGDCHPHGEPRRDDAADRVRRQPRGAVRGGRAGAARHRARRGRSPGVRRHRWRHPRQRPGRAAGLVEGPAGDDPNPGRWGPAEPPARPVAWAWPAGSPRSSSTAATPPRSPRCGPRCSATRWSKPTRSRWRSAAGQGRGRCRRCAAGRARPTPKNAALAQRHRRDQDAELQRLLAPAPPAPTSGRARRAGRARRPRGNGSACSAARAALGSSSGRPRRRTA